ncbi:MULTISPECIES: DUF3313 domain-containing protein [Nitrosomonas]|uniref:Uncharacterized protein DUF3313 n=1 Tax=Nitrosomonas communis TaxID=44574 RepID=A0A0F7KGQ5_9PROT|nr:MULTISPECIES: DUF3313 domain-containing protein [Nitrosomonas]AKH37984.1 hypothetical protein AAW31_09430 [Nitrosomonas communis]TYP91589.1 uncharacterized protein DUF3313 [Nitrosomonas communis]UVS59866.1 DUF3313 domain-containing protein [Nitrosomonas sp. PLL12]
MMIQRAILIGICAAMLTACATTEQAGGFGKAEPSGFLQDYSMLHPAANETEASLVYFTPDKTKFRSYTKILLEPVQVWRGEKSSAKNIDMEDANHLSQFLWSRVDEELRKDYTMVQQPGPGVLRVRIGITEAGKGIPVLDNVTAMHPGSLIVSKGKKALSGTESLVGKSSIEMEATDSQTGELLGAGVDRRGGGKYAWKSLNRWEDVEQAFTYWAKKIRWRACTMRGDAVCEKPKD